MISCSENQEKVDETNEFKVDYEKFEDFVSFTLIGKKKAKLEREQGILELIDQMMVELEERTNLDHEKCLELLRTSAGVIAESLTNSTQDQPA